MTIKDDIINSYLKIINDSDRLCLWTENRMLKKTKSIYENEELPLVSDNPKIIFEKMKNYNMNAIAIKSFNDCLSGICRVEGTPVFVYSETKIKAKIKDSMKDRVFENSDELVNAFFHVHFIDKNRGINAPIFLVDLTKL